MRSPLVFRRLSYWFDRFAKKRWAAILVVAVLIVAIRVALLPRLGVPQPMASDEFSQLLAAKTFASGRWTNPTHPMWVHFEAPYVIHQPSYASKYPPGPPLMMALGIVIAGHAWAGVLLAAALMCGAFCWMLQGWVPARWALAGALLTVARYSLHHYWINSYWGGAFAAFGGALVLGALPRVLRQGNTSAALAMGLGFAVLVSSRPYEGLLFSIVPGTMVLAWTLRGGRSAMFRRAATVLVPIALILAAAAVPYAYYNWKVSGSPWKLPYAVHIETYEPVPHLIWQPVKETPVYQHTKLRDFYNSRGQFQRQRTASGAVNRIAAVIGLPNHDSNRSTILHPKVLANAAFGVALLLSILLVLRDRRMRVPLMICALMIAGLVMETWFFDHYAAPMAGLTLLIVVQGLRHVSVWRCWRRRVGYALAPVAAGLALAAVALYSLVLVRFLVEPPGYIKVDRPRTLAHVSKIPGKHLVLIRYDSGYDLHDGDWVYNEPDIDSAEIVLARDMGPARNAKLFEYFEGRQIWTVYKGKGPARIHRGAGAAAQQSP